eukprot:SM000113S24053  [mRNA]  locus=s113:101191:103036:- [translate_table: standard]
MAAAAAAAATALAASEARASSRRSPTPPPLPLRNELPRPDRRQGARLVASFRQSLPPPENVADKQVRRNLVNRRRALQSQSGQETAPLSQIVTTPFHLAFPVHDLAAARVFYGGVLGCPEGRSATTWVDFNLFGHQIVCHVVPGYNAAATANTVDGDSVPVPHFGLAMSEPQFLELASRLRESGVEFVIEPHIRFKGQPGEQWTMFFKDHSGNSLEFKAMTNPLNLFAKYVVNSET